MADYDSSLPIRTESAGDVDIFISDATISTQKLKVNADGSIDVNATATDLDIRDLVFATDKVDVSGSSVTVSATDLDIRDLLFASDSVDVSGSQILGITNDVNIADGGNSITVDAVDFDIRDLAFATDSVDVSGSSVTVSATDLDIRDLAFATDSVDVSGSSVTVSATDLDIRDLDAAQDSVQANLFDEAGVAFSATNPLPVVVSSDSEGDEVCDYNTSAAVAKDASVNHDYSVTALKTFIGEEAWISGSGKLKVELLINGAVKFTGFNSTSNPNVRIPLDRMPKGDAGEVIRFTITNRDNQAQDLYSTLTGLEV